MLTLAFEDLEVEIQKQGSNLTFDEYIELDMTELPAGIQSITVSGSLDGNQLTKLLEDITIEANGHIWLDSLTTMGNDVAIEADGTVYLNNLTTMGNNITIKATWGIEFSDTNTGITEISLTDDPVSNEVRQFLIHNNITVRCPEISPLVNLAFEGVNLEIMA